VTNFSGKIFFAEFWLPEIQILTVRKLETFNYKGMIPPAVRMRKLLNADVRDVNLYHKMSRFCKKCGITEVRKLEGCGTPEVIVYSK
jgi:hypothetical protein